MENSETFQLNEHEDFEYKIKPNENDEINKDINSIELESIGASPSASSIVSETPYNNTQASLYMNPYPNFPYPYPTYAWGPSPASTDGANTNWYGPYPMPPSSGDTNSQAAFAQQPHFAVYPYYYPYYSPHFPHPSLQHGSNMPSYAPYAPVFPAFTYPVVPSQSQSSNSACASSVPPDIIVTPSTDEKPSQVVLQRHFRVENPDPPNRSNFVQFKVVNEDLYNENQHLHRQESSVADHLTLENLDISKSSEKFYSGENVKDFSEKPPIDNLSTTPDQALHLNTECTKENMLVEDEDDSDVTPKYQREKPLSGLQTKKSVTDIQIYQKIHNKQEQIDDSDSETTCDEESQIFDDEDMKSGEIIIEKVYEVEDQYNGELVQDNDLSVIYEEESELEASSGLQQTIKQTDSNTSELTTVEEDYGNASLVEGINENEIDEIHEDENSVTVRLPLKFSFNNDDQIATVEVGSSQIQKKRGDISSVHKHGTFAIAEIEDNSDIDESEVSVTVSLSSSSYSTPTKHEAALTPKKELNEEISSDSEDISVSLSLNMRNKFLGQTMEGGVTNNIAAGNISEEKTRNIEKKYDNTNDNNKNINDIDFFATLRATKLQAQKVMEQSTSIWGKLSNQNDENSNATKKNETEPADMSESVIKEGPVDTNKTREENSEEEDFWAFILNSKQGNGWELKRKPICTPMTLEKIKEVQNIASTPHLSTYELPQSQNATMSFIRNSEDEFTHKSQSEVEIDFWTLIESAKSNIGTHYSASKTHKCLTHKPIEEKMSPDMANDKFIAEQDKPYDPTQYPLEPREVDTDEEIDFWAEIEAGKSTNEDNADDEDMNFFQASSFWVSRERQNSIDETPFKPVLPKAFPARLPEQSAAVDIETWTEALEASRGDEPTIIDPNSDSFNVSETQLETFIEDSNLKQNFKPKSVQDNQNTLHKSSIENIFTDTEFSEAVELNDSKTKPQAKESDELEVKRNNYRKAMAFFKTSIDENSRDHVINELRNKSGQANRKSMIVENQTPLLNIEFRKTRSNENIFAACESSTVDIKNNSPPILLEPGLSLLNTEPKMSTTNPLPNEFSDLRTNETSSTGTQKLSIRERISAFETINANVTEPKKPELQTHSLLVDSCTPKSSLSRNSSSQRSESEMEEDDSGVTDMNKLLSETDTESESFPELRKMSSYQRAATHSRLFKLLQDENELQEDTNLNEEHQLKPSRRKIIHNVSITRKQNPNALSDAETMTERRERLSLPLRKNTSIDADNPSTPNSPASPIVNNAASNKAVSDKLVNELVQSLLLKSDGRNLKNIPMAKLQAAAKRVLEEEIGSLENTSVDSTPNDVGKQDKNYVDYYNSWSDATGKTGVIPSKSFRALQETHRRSPWTARCPRVLSSKTVNRDLARVTESPEIPTGSSKSPECFSRENSVSRPRKL